MKDYPAMVRIIIDGLLIFMIPFAAYAIYQAWAEKDPKAAFRMTHGPFIRLAIIGLLLCIGSIIVGEIRAPHIAGEYQRAQWKDGKLIDGTVKP